MGRKSLVYSYIAQKNGYDPAGVSESLDIGDEDESASPDTTLVRDGAPEPTDIQSVSDLPSADSDQAIDNPSMRQAIVQSNAMNNMAQAFSPLAAGGTKAVDNSGLFQSMNQQGKELASMENAAQSRSAAVKKAILALQAKKDVADNANETKKEIAANQNAAYRDRTAAMSGNQKSRLDNSNIRTANTILNDPNLTKETTKLNATRSLQALLGDIQSGKLTDSGNVRRQLSNMLVGIEQGGGGSAEDRRQMGVDTLYGQISDLASKLSGQPLSSIPGAYLNQIASEAHALGDRAAMNYKTLSDSKLSGADLSGGNPDVDTGAVYNLAKQRRDLFLKSSGYDPESGNPLGRGPSQSGAPGGFVLIKDPKGIVRKIPASQKDAALKAGGVLSG